MAAGPLFAIGFLIAASLFIASPRPAGAKCGIRPIDPDYWSDRRFIRVEFHEADHQPKPPFHLRKLSEEERASIERARRGLPR